MKKKLSTVRLGIVFFLITLCWVAVLARFAQVQVVHGEKYNSLVVRQCWGENRIPARRGAILDRNGKTLAFDVQSQSFYTYAADRNYLRKLGRRISRITGERGLTQRLLSRPGEFNYLARTVTPEAAEKITALQMDSVYSRPLYLRVYPYGEVARDLLGEINVDKIGISGMERVYEDLLKPEPGVARFQRDGWGKIYCISDDPLIAPVDGCDLKLTLDIEYQQIVEEELRKAVEKWKANWGMACFVETSTGRLVAADYFEPSEADKVGHVFKTRFVSDLFEPGSTFKLVAFAGMLDQELFSLTDTIWAGMGKFKFNNRTLHDDKELGTITFRRAFELSSNIATARFCQKLGAKGLFKYCLQFGFGHTSGIDIPGEESGRLAKPEVWSELWTAHTSIGHGVSVTALQMANAFAAVANGGRLMRPYVVEEIRSGTGRLKRRTIPEMIRLVMSDDASEVLRDLMAGVVDSGTANVAKIDEVSFAGKTGTAQKPNTEDGGYYHDRYIASFAGFFPREEPRIAGIILLDEPDKINYGGYTAGPAFAEIARRITVLDRTRENDAAFVADTLQDESKEFAKSVPRPDKPGEPEADLDSNYGIIRDWFSGVSHHPEIEERDLREQRKELVNGIMPDLVGLSSTEAISLMSSCQLDVVLNGAGSVISHSPEAGTDLKNAQRIVVNCGTDRGGIY